MILRECRTVSAGAFSVLGVQIEKLVLHHAIKELSALPGKLTVHLDVYKRQAIERPLLHFHIKPGESLKISEFFFQSLYLQHQLSLPVTIRSGSVWLTPISASLPAV